MLLVAIAAVHRPGAIGLEGNLTCLSALCARGIMHLSGAAAKAASVSASISFHVNSLTFGIDSTNRSYYKASHQTQLIRRYAASCQRNDYLIYLSVYHLDSISGDMEMQKRAKLRALSVSSTIPTIATIAAVSS
jgi:hypothetical protein